MTNYLTDLTFDLLEFEGLTETIELEQKQSEEALQLSQKVKTKGRQWQVYLQYLALFGFEEWLHKRAVEIPVNRKKCSVVQPQYANFMDAVCNLQVGDFKVCLIPSICFTDEEITIPRAVVDLPEFKAHFYVAIGIDSELELVGIRGFLRHDKLTEFQSQLQPEEDWNYYLPLTCFNREIDQLLLYLQCLSPEAIPLPEIPTNRQANLARMQTKLKTLLLQLTNIPLWKVLTWEQGISVLTTPDLINWLYKYQIENKTSLKKYLADLLQILTKKAVNASRWVSNEMEEMLPEISWEIWPTMSPSPMRKSNSFSSEDLQEIIREIRRDCDLKIPEIAGIAYQNIFLGTEQENINNTLPKMRLYAMSWSLSEINREWALLLILTTIPGSITSSNFKWRITDQTGILVEEEFILDKYETYLFTQVEGTYDEKFLLTINRNNEEDKISRLFEFCPEKFN
ncbi:MAG: DUF1822 family protein [Moorea sp. SIO2B7]|nr:DUF1822 family protein [Moorena sp. SIO2B7]